MAYDIPLKIHLGPPALTVTKVKHGVTDVSLSDGRTIRISLHIEGVKEQDQKLDINYNAVVEILPVSDSLMMEVHEGLQ